MILNILYLWIFFDSSFFYFPLPDSEEFFQVLANSQGRRLNDQRVSLPSLPGIGNGSTSTVPKRNVSYLLFSLFIATIYMKKKILRRLPP